MVDTLRIIRPFEWQVVQRWADKASVLWVEAACARESFVEARTVSSNGAGPWQPMSFLSSGNYGCDLPVDAGGWYRVEVRASLKDGKTLESSVDRVGVGEVFVVAGQSNAANYGGDEDARMSCENARGVTYGDGRWLPAVDPLPGATGTGGSPWCPFADALIDALNVPVAVASVAVGGAAMSTWLPEAEHYPRLAAVLRHLGPNGARAVLWHQGESDNEKRTTSDQYYDGMRRIIEASRRDAGYDVTWFVANASFIPARYEPRSEISDEVRAAQARLWVDEIALQGPDTDDLIGPAYRCSDEIHMNRNGLIAHGRRWFDCVTGRLFQ